MTSPDILDRLQAWASGHDAYVRAAITLLASQPRWLHDDDLIAACVITDGHGTYLSFAALNKFVASNPPCSAGEMVMLRLIADIGTERYQFSRLDAENRRLALEALTEAIRR